jgi:hypothetical protein
MKRFAMLLVVMISGMFSPIFAQEKTGLRAHEWGTFTTLTRGDGQMMEWNPLGAPSDLPNFVHKGTERVKTALTGTVRMETPVIYFYTEKPMTVDVAVDFKGGMMTEWFPKADWKWLAPESLRWPKVELLPNESPKLPGDGEKGHYFAARDAKATPLRVTTGEPPVTEHEGYLFYRGVGSPSLPLEVRADRNGIRVKSLAEDAIPYIVFQNRDGKCDYGVYGAWREKNNMEVPLPGPASIRWDGVDHVEGLEKLLLMQGLEIAETKAMIKTWKNDWFEPGLRVFWIVPQKSVDAFLPLTITPKPDALLRVFVGRVEILTPEFEAAAKDAVDQALADRPEALKKLGRFARHFVEKRLSEAKPGSDEASRLQIILATSR